MQVQQGAARERNKMGEFFNGSWVSEKNENLNELLLSLDVGMLARGIVRTVNTTLDIEFFGNGKFKITTHTGPVKRVTEFTVDVEYDTEAPNGEKIKGTWKLEEGALVGDFNGLKKGKFSTRRAVKDTQLIQTMTYDGIVCTRHFKKK